MFQFKLMFARSIFFKMIYILAECNKFTPKKRTEKKYNRIIKLNQKYTFNKRNLKKTTIIKLFIIFLIMLIHFCSVCFIKIKLISTFFR